MDFLERLKKHTEDLSYAPDTILIGAYNEDSNSIAIRPTPNSIDTRYMSKGKIYPFSFQILVHHENNLTAYTISQQLLKEYEELTTSIVSTNDSYTLLTIKCTTLPNVVEKTDFGTLWTAIYEAELYIKGGQ